MSGYMITVIALVSFTLVFIVVYKTSTKIYNVKRRKYRDAYEKEHPEARKRDFLEGYHYAENEIRKTLFGKFCEFMDDIDKKIITLIIYFSVVIAAINGFLAVANANHELDELKKEKERMAENSSITRQNNVEEWKKFNERVDEAYNKVPAFDKALFLDDNIVDELKIPINE